MHRALILPTGNQFLVGISGVTVVNKAMGRLGFLIVMRVPAHYRDVSSVDGHILSSHPPLQHLNPSVEKGSGINKALGEPWVLLDTSTAYAKFIF